MPTEIHHFTSADLLSLWKQYICG